MPTRLPRWTWMLSLPVLVGALLVMHVLDAQASVSHQWGTLASAGVVEEHPHDDPVHAEHGHCVECLAAHVMAACVAVIAAVCGLALVRRLVRGTLAAPVAAVAGRVQVLVELARPPDPAWVRLSVMRC